MVSLFFYFSFLVHLVDDKIPGFNEIVVKARFIVVKDLWMIEFYVCSLNAFGYFALLITSISIISVSRFETVAES